MSHRLKIHTLLGLLLGAVLFSGCAGYRLGSMLPTDIKTVYVPTVVNNTSEPRIETDVTGAIISQIQMDGSLRIAADAERADSILEVVLTRFWLDPVAYVSGESSTANEYRMNISASFVLRSTTDNAILAESLRVTGWADFDRVGDMTSSKNVALRPAANDLGRRIVERMVEYW